MLFRSNITNATNWDVRADKIIAFQSPKINGFQGSVAYASDIANTSRVTENASAISLNSFYKNGKFILGAAYERHDLDDTSANTDALRLSGIYKDGPLKMVGFYQKEDNDFATTAEPDAKVFGVGIAYKKAKGTLKAQFYTRDVDSTRKKSDLVVLGYDYKLLRKLDIYAQVAKITNATSLGGYDLGSATSETANSHGVSFGVRYKF